MSALYPYSYGATLMSLDNVCLEYDGFPILKNVKAEIKKIDRPGQVCGQVIGILGPSGTGKCLAPGTPVLMFDGTIKSVENVEVGDLLMGPDSHPRRVLSLAHGFDEMYDVVPIKGDTYRVNKPHVLSLYVGRGKRSKARIDNISVGEYLTRSNTYKGKAKGYRVGVEFSSQEVPLDPYFLGLWLGDGDSDSPAITSQDSDVVDALHVCAASMGAEVSTYAYGDSCPRYRVHNDWNRSHSMLSTLRDLGVMNNKHIPWVYKANSREARLQLLAGLIDSDGSPSGGGYDFISKLELLANDVCYIARSLGFAAYMTPCTKTCQTGNGGIYYRVSISGCSDVLPVKIERKKLPLRRQIKSVLHTGISVVPAGYGEYFGFQIDGDGLFLLGDFTVTHNTQLFRLMAGLNKPTSGRVTINGFDRGVRAGEVGMVPQSYPLFEHHTVEGNLMLAARRKEPSDTAALAKVKEMLAAFKLDDKLKMYPAQLSGGQCQRIAIIQQVLCSSHYLVMDEPFSGLDIIMEEKTLKLIMDIANMEQGLNTVIVVTHDISAAVSVCDHIWMLGRDRNANGESIPGAYIKKEYDLIERGLCWEQWQEHSATRPAVADFIREVKEEFYTL